MAKPDKCGIYAIEQTGTARLYNGSSRAVLSRWNEHRYLLNRGKQTPEQKARRLELRRKSEQKIRDQNRDTIPT